MLGPPPEVNEETGEETPEVNFDRLADVKPWLLIISRTIYLIAIICIICIIIIIIIMIIFVRVCTRLSAAAGLRVWTTSARKRTIACLLAPVRAHTPCTQVPIS